MKFLKTVSSIKNVRCTKTVYGKLAHMNTIWILSLLDFQNGDILECTTVNFAYEKGRNGLPKKECLPIYQSFEGLAKIDIKKGILIDGQPIKTL